MRKNFTERSANRTARTSERAGRGPSALRLRTTAHVAGARGLADQPQADFFADALKADRNHRVTFYWPLT